jgi:hypothetical protein
LIAALFAAAVAAYPAPAHAAMAIDDAAGVRAFLDAAGAHARSVSSEEVGRQLREAVGLDPLTMTVPRTIVFAPHAIGMVTAMDAAKAKAVLAIWKRPTRIGLALKGKLYTASGKEAQALLKAMQKPRAIDKRLQTKGPVSLWFSLAPPLQSAGLSLEASALGFELHGLVTSAKPILQGPAPARCEGSPMGCVTAGLGPAGRELLMRALVMLGQPTPRGESAGATRVAGRLDGVDALALSGERSLPSAMHYVLAFDWPGAAADNCQTPQGLFALSNPPCSPLPKLDEGSEAADASLDLAKADEAMAKLTALDALKGEYAAGAFGVHLIYGELLRHLGPLTLHAEPSKNAAAAVELSLHLPLH